MTPLVSNRGRTVEFDLGQTITSAATNHSTSMYRSNEGFKRGRMVLIDTKGDRMVEWRGTNNFFLVPLHLTAVKWCQLVSNLTAVEPLQGKHKKIDLQMEVEPYKVIRPRSNGVN